MRARDDNRLAGAATLTLADPALFRQQCYVNGAWQDAPGGATLPVENPATGERLGTVKSRLHYGLQALRAAYDAAARPPGEASR